MSLPQDLQHGYDHLAGLAFAFHDDGEFHRQGSRDWLGALGGRALRFQPELLPLVDA
jgi:hypothetical protein